MQVVGILMVRNSLSTIRACVLHNLSLGLDRLVVIDDGSTDGTERVLNELSRDPRLHVTHNDIGYRQQEAVSAAACAASRDGADWILPIDADEFWWVEGGGLRDVLSATRAGVLQAPVRNFIQRREQATEAPDALLHMTYRTAAPCGSAEEASRLVQSNAIGYVEMSYPPKCVMRASPSLKIYTGNHRVKGAPGQVEAAKSILCLHAPLIARSVMERKARDYWPRAQAAGWAKKGSGVVWHFERWQQMLQAGTLEAEWAANSHHEGSLDVFGQRHNLLKDTSLRDLVAPHIVGG